MGGAAGLGKLRTCRGKRADYCRLALTEPMTAKILKERGKPRFLFPYDKSDKPTCRKAKGIGDEGRNRNRKQRAHLNSLSVWAFARSCSIPAVIGDSWEPAPAGYRSFDGLPGPGQKGPSRRAGSDRRLGDGFRRSAQPSASFLKGLNLKGLNLGECCFHRLIGLFGEIGIELASSLYIVKEPIKTSLCIFRLNLKGVLE